MKLPHHEETERILAGAVVAFGADALAVLAGLVGEDDFYTPGAQAIFAAGHGLWSRREVVDIATIEAELQARGDLKVAGGLAGLNQLAGSYRGWHELEQHARRLQNIGRTRRLSQVCWEILDAGEHAVADPMAWLEEFETRLLEVLRRDNPGSAHTLAQTFEVVHGRILARLRKEPVRGLTTGFPELDVLLYGRPDVAFEEGELEVIAARPSMGKTALVLNLIAKNAITPANIWAAGRRPRMAPVLFFSLEMGFTRIGERMWAHEAQVPFKKIRDGRVEPEEMGRLLAARPRCDAADIIIDDAGGLSITEIRARVRRWRSDRRRFPGGSDDPVGLIGVDYLQLVRASQKRGGAGENREQQVAEISRELKALAKDTRCVVLALSQLNRAVDSREDHRPNIGDLRESGAIEQDADVIIFPYREAHYLPKTAPLEQRERLRRKAELIAGKARNGETGVVEVVWRGDTQSFSPLNRFDRLEENQGGQT